MYQTDTPRVWNSLTVQYMQAYVPDYTKIPQMSHQLGIFTKVRILVVFILIDIT